MLQTVIYSGLMIIDETLSQKNLGETLDV